MSCEPIHYKKFVDLRGVESLTNVQEALRNVLNGSKTNLS